MLISKYFDKIIPSNQVKSYIEIFMGGGGELQFQNGQVFQFQNGQAWTGFPAPAAEPEELLISDIFNGFDTNGYTFANPPVVADQDGKLRISAAGSLACEGGRFNEASNIWETRTGVGSSTISTLTGSKTVYADTDPTVWKRASVSPTRTNKCTCRKTNPTDTTNLTKSGDAAAVLSVVDDTAALAAAGLDKICTSGKVYKLDNSAGITAAQVVNSVTGNTNPHSVSVYQRGGSGFLDTNQSPGRLTFTASTDYARTCATNITPADAGKPWRVQADAGQTIYFILPQLEEGAFCTDPIITVADPLASITRTGTSITKPTTGLFPMTSATEAQNFGIYMRVIPKAAGQVAKLLASYTDANNCTCLDVTGTTIVFNKRLAGTDVAINRSITHAVGVPIDVLAIQTNMGMSIKVRSYSGGAWSAWSAWTNDETANGKLAAKITATLEIGAANSTGHMYGNAPLGSTIKLGNRATLADYQAIAEVEVNKING